MIYIEVRFGAINGSAITVDSALSETSENPVQNRVITDAIKNIRDTVITDVVYQTGDSVIEPNKFNVWLEPITSKLKITKGTDIENILNHYYIRFTVGEGLSLALAGFGTITWYSFVPTWTVGKTYEISIIGNLVLWAEF